MRVFIFRSTRGVIRAEGEARKARLRIRVIPVPRSISPHCGMALECDEEASRSLEELLSGSRIEFSLHRREDLSL